ncbi:uncharacterized protein LOC125499766 [Athalia rosae]|uniref:uncharacterized protein LOC125499766 n=1 Tax=Athalia rosae TaxID=37344 RepID=UPI0020334876|nr:uncharacterized protein LOC125499766 [Athalia rosae]
MIDPTYVRICHGPYISIEWKVIGFEAVRIILMLASEEALRDGSTVVVTINNVMAVPDLIGDNIILERCPPQEECFFLVSECLCVSVIREEKISSVFHILLKFVYLCSLLM